ncbi:MAG: sugar phosphate isomerase/epimerase [Sedimentisphaerales bacterium]|nr:sugar phosphate isomerase/epimerase [Sedimentisphaerales bacterium]
MNTIDRRDFLKYTAAIAAGAGLTAAPAAAQEANTARPLLKAVQIQMLPGDLLDVDKFKLAKRCGYTGVEAVPLESLEACKKQADAAREAGITIHSVLYGWWPSFLNKDDVAKKAVAEMEHALRCAKAMGAGTVLMVPSRVTDDYSYGDAYRDSQALIRKLIGLAKELEVVIAVENVWNKFLLSPLEFARYIDEFDSPWVKAYFDVGNVIIYGFSQDWIRTLGKRIAKIHLKDFKRDGYKWVDLGEGDVNWKQVSAALTEIGYRDYLTTEVRGGDEAWLTELSQRIDKLITII